MPTEEPKSDRTRDDHLAEVIERFLEASETGSAPSRAVLLEQHPELAEDLAACFETLDFIGHSLGEGPATAVLQCGQQFGEYQILREIGRGGMGVVYEAYHLGLERRVALKVLSGRSFDNAEQREQFLQEARTAARLHHTNIVPIFEVGELDGICYYAMQFIAGESLGRMVRRLAGRSGGSASRPDITIFPPGTIVRDDGAARERADRPSSRRSDGALVAFGHAAGGEVYFREVGRIMVQAAEAIAHAHMHGVVHRDVKPSNFILDAEGRVWVTDFGLAFRSDDPRQKAGRQAVGTPAYMSPEQVRPDGTAVDYRTDIYSLGATMYELLTLRPVFEGDNSLAILTQIASSKPPPPRRINPKIPRDLDCIVRRAIAKRPEERYGDAAEMASDLRRYLTYLPVAARRLGPVGRLILWCRREPRLAAVSAAAACLLLILSTISHWAILRARNVAVRARQQAESQLDLTTRAEAQARENLREALFQQARATSLSFHNGRRWATLDLIRQAQTIRHDESLRDDAINALSIPDARLVNRLQVDKIVERLAFCPARRLLAFSCGDGSVRLWEFTTEGEGTGAVTELAASGIDHETVTFSTCGRYLAGVETDGPIVVWDTANKTLLSRLELDDFRPRFVCFTADRTVLAAINVEGTCRRWQVTDATLRDLEPLETTRWWSAATVGPGPDHVTLIAPNGEIQMWDLAAGRQRSVGEITLNRGRPGTIRWDADGKHLVAAQRSEVDLWSVGQVQPRSLGGHHGTVQAAAFHPFAELLATSGSRDPAVKLWDVTTGDLIAMLHEPLAGSLTTGFSPDGQFLAAGGNDKAIWLWEIVAPKSFRRWAAHEDVVTQVAVSPDGSLIASGSADGSVALWQSEGKAAPVPLASRVHDRDTRFRTHACAGLMFSPDGRRLAARLRNGSISVWDTATHKPVATLDAEPNMRTGGAAFLPNGQEIIRISNRTIERWTIDSPTTRHTVAKSQSLLSAMALSPDGRFVLVCTTDGRVQRVDIESGELTQSQVELPGQGVSMAIDPAGGQVAIADRSGMVHLLETETLALLKSWRESDDELTTVAFSPAGEWLGVTGQDGTVRLRGMPNAQLVATLTKHEGGSRSLAFGPLGVKLLTCGDDKLIHVWQLESLNTELAGLDLAWK